MAKQFWMKFEMGLWRHDPNLSKCAPATRGIWMDLVCAMAEDDGTGTICGTVEQLARIARCSPDEMRAAVHDLRATATAEVHEENGVVTLTCRKMQREHHARQLYKQRQLRSRSRKNDAQGHAQCHADVTPKSRENHAVELELELETPLVPLPKNGESHASISPLEDDPKHETFDPGRDDDGDDGGYGSMSPDLLRIVRDAGAEFNLSPAKIPELNEWIRVVKYPLAKKCLDEAMAKTGLSGFHALLYIRPMSIQRHAQAEIKNNRPAHQQSGRFVREDR